MPCYISVMEHQLNVGPNSNGKGKLRTYVAIVVSLSGVLMLLRWGHIFYLEGQMRNFVHEQARINV